VSMCLGDDLRAFFKVKQLHDNTKRIPIGYN
jgi:hypothetical protein